MPLHLSTAPGPACPTEGLASVPIPGPLSPRRVRSVCEISGTCSCSFVLMCLFLLHFLVRAGTRVEDISPFHSQDAELRNEVFPGVPGLLFLQGPFSLSWLRALGRDGLALLRTV